MNFRDFINYLRGNAGSRSGFRRFAAFAFCMAGGLAGCVSVEETVPPVSAAVAGYAPAAIEGRRLYVRRCGQCHELTPVAEYTWREWQPIMDEMAVESKFSVGQKAAVLEYVKAHCAR